MSSQHIKSHLNMGQSHIYWTPGNTAVYTFCKYMSHHKMLEAALYVCGPELYLVAGFGTGSDPSIFLPWIQLIFFT